MLPACHTLECSRMGRSPLSLAHGHGHGHIACHGPATRDQPGESSPGARTEATRAQTTRRLEQTRGRREEERKRRLYEHRALRQSTRELRRGSPAVWVHWGGVGANRVPDRVVRTRSAACKMAHGTWIATTFLTHTQKVAPALARLATPPTLLRGHDEK